MALVLANRVQESATANTTVSFTLTGAVTGFQTFAVIGDTNTTYYSATDTSGNWEVGLGTYSTTGPTLTRTTIYASSNANNAVTFPGTVNVFVTYPSGRSVNLDASGNVSALGTVSSGTWQGSTVGVAYGGTGVTTSSGANSVMLRDANQNVAVNRLNQSNTDTSAAGGTTALTAASSYSQTLTGTGNQTYTMPDATTLTTGVAFVFNNNATGTLTLQDYATGSIGTITSGGAAELVLLNNGTTAGTWDVHGFLPENVTWGTNALNLGSTVISGGTWQGGTIQPGYGGTGLTTFAGANNALYSTGASTLTAGTLPVAAGGTGITAFGTGVATALGVNVGTAGAFVVNGGALGTPSSGTVTNLTGTASININGTVGATTPNTGSFTSLTDSGNLSFTGTGNRITGDFSNATLTNRVSFQSSTTNGATVVQLIPNGTSTSSQFSAYGGSDILNTSVAQLTNNGTEVRIASGIFGTGTYLPMTFYTGGSERMRIDTSGNINIATSGGRITGDFSNATVANRVAIQTSTANSATVVGILPNGTGTTTALQVNNNSDLTVALAFGNLQASSTEVTLQSGIRNAGSYLPMTFYTGGSERMRIDTSGNVGIGTSSPGSKLEVNQGILTINTTDQSLTRLQLKTTGTGGRTYEIVGGLPGTNNSQLSFYDATAAATRMTIDSSGNVGIGTSSPATKLDVLGSTGILTRAAATQDGVALVGRAGGTGSFEVTLTPTTLTADRTLTLPDNSGTVLTTGATVTVAQGGTGATSLTANNVLLGNGTSAVQVVAPGTSGNVLTSNGTTWTSAAAPAAATTISDDTTTNATRYLTFTSATSGTVSTLNVSSTKLTYNPSTGALSSTTVAGSSDERLKKNWRDLPQDLIEQLAKVKAGIYDRTDHDAPVTQVGVSAQSLQMALPNAVISDNDGMLSVAYGNAALVAAIKLAERVLILEKRIAALETAKG